jgi:hypothetical protein
MDGIGIHHIEKIRQSFKSQACFHLYVESRLKIITISIITGKECKMRISVKGE